MKGYQLNKISVDAIAIGMYIFKLDRPWQNTPFFAFADEGFYVRDRDEIKRLKANCNHVFVDPEKGLAPSPNDVLTSEEFPEAGFSGKLKPLKIDTSVYSQVSPLNKEMKQAQTFYDNLVLEMNRVMSMFSRKQKLTKESSEMGSFIPLINNMVDSLIRNPDAFVWLVRVRKDDESEPYYYLLRVACWAVIFGRHLGLSKNDLQSLALAALFKDVGGLQAEIESDDIEGVTPSRQESVAMIERTLALVKQFDVINPKVLKTIKMHCERLDGHGFPQGLKGDHIFLLAKILGIASYYDQVSYLQGKKCSAATSKAVSRLYKVRGIHFQDDLVVEFIKAIGVYPTGTLVKLSNQQIAVVAEQNYSRRLKPKILLVVDETNKELDKYRYVDLVDDGVNIDIVEDVEPYDHPIKVTKIRCDHIAANTKKKLFGFL